MTSANPTATVPGQASKNPLVQLLAYGQSVWLDYIRRDLFTTGELARLIREDGLRGMTSNPTIFEKAIAGSDLYADQLKEFAGRTDMDPKAIFEQLAIKDIQSATDAMRGVYEASKTHDGYVSLEVAPTLANKTQETIEEARRLWKAVSRANTMIKVPGTTAGLPAFRQLISEGINVNVTLLFAQDVYEKVAWAYIEGLEERVTKGGDVSHVASVASFFVSRIDTLVDSMITDKLKDPHLPEATQSLMQGVRGKVAIANAKLAYQAYKRIFSGPRWEALQAKGAQVQRVLWASTSTKNPMYRDTLYVEELIGPDTVDTIPPATFDSFRDHGRLRNSLEENIPGAERTMQDLAAAGISMKKVTDQLTDEGVRLFEDAFDKLLAAVEKKINPGAVAEGPGNLSYKLPPEFAAAVTKALEDCNKYTKVQRLWSHDPTLWTGKDENQWLGWLDIVDQQKKHIEDFAKVAADLRASDITHVLLLGMGGSSLCVEVLKLTFGRIPGGPAVFVLDSTDPAQVKSVERQVDLRKTVFIVSSKSGSTLEPNIFKQYFYERTKEMNPGIDVGKRFIAITDPGSKMEGVAKADGFRYIFYGVPSIGGRYSALSDFGVVPGAIQGLDIPQFLDRAGAMAKACQNTDAAQNPGVILGAILGEGQKIGRDKVTIFTSPGISDLGAWLEQLLAESTGKEGKGLIPVDREDIGAPDIYGSDRLFVYLRHDASSDSKQDLAVSTLEKAGQPVVRIKVPDTYDVAQEFFRWEIATAIAGSIIGINAFNQPDVEASKIETRKLTSEYEQKGSLPAETPIFEGDGVKLFTGAKNAATLKQAVGKDATLVGYLKAHLGRLKAGDYFALLAYIQMTDAYERMAQEIRHSVRGKKKVATCVGFGPRFLHSTGQAYKGGPNSGVFLQVTCDDAADLPVPQQKYTFGVVKAAQARGDFQVLADRDRRALRVHLGTDVSAGLDRLRKAIEQALA
jgi:transaldolase/glucose-6-phosphate isomerase